MNKTFFNIKGIKIAFDESKVFKTEMSYIDTNPFETRFLNCLKHKTTF